MTQGLSAVVCTRNRPGPIAAAVDMLLTGEGEQFELIIVDQSDGPETQEALARFSTDSRLRYIHTDSRGKGKALNEGLAVARSEVIVCTDDDCQAPPGWVSAMTEALNSKPEAVIAFCQVVPVPHDCRAGYVPSYQFNRNRSLRDVRDIRGGMGLGAGMAVRRKFVTSIGGFDDSFGPGGRFPSADEWDLSLRALLMGHEVYEATGISIVHDGFRSLADGRTHVRRDWVALGAVLAKPLRAGHWSTMSVVFWLLSRCAIWPICTEILALRRPRGFGRITAFVRGFISGLATPVDRKTLLFLNRSESSGQAR